MMTFATKWTDEMIETLRTMFAADKSYQEIAEAVGFSRKTVIKQARKIGLPKRPAPTPEQMKVYGKFGGIARAEAAAKRKRDMDTAGS